MSTHTQSAHWDYTCNEWKSKNHTEMLDIVFKNEINIIYDIGANVGGTAYTFLNYAKNNNLKIPKIYCFEPDKDNMIFLKRKLKQEIDQGLVVPVEKGVYYGLKKAKAFGLGHCSEGRIHPNVGGMGIEECMKKVEEKRNKNGESVFAAHVSNKFFELDTLENLTINFEKPDFIKIDVEGAELNILKNSTLINEAKYINVEWNQEESIENSLKCNNLNFECVFNRADYLLKK